MGLKTFEIMLDASMAVFYSGQAVTGRVVVHLLEAKIIRGIRLKVRGEARVFWEESSRGRDSGGKTNTVHSDYEATEVYLDTEVYLLGQSAGEVTAPKGDSSYPFCVPLPQNLPPSFEGSHGSVRYFLAATMDVAWRLDPENIVPFSVVSLLDLNMEPTAKKPVQVTREKFLCCCCCRKGPLSLVLSLPTRGYVPGQEIPLTVELDNATSRAITNVVCHLTQEVRFHATRPKIKIRTSSMKIFQLKFPGVEANSSSTLVEKLRVPSLPPSYLKHCTIIDVSYILTVEAVIKGPHLNLYADADLVIGTIPLLSSCPGAGQEPAVGWAVAPQDDPRPAWHSPQPWDPTLYPTIPPPLYEAYKLSEYEDKEAQREDNNKFTPFYPTFSLPA